MIPSPDKNSYCISAIQRYTGDKLMLFFPENRVGYFMQFVPFGDNYHKILYFLGKIINISKCCLLNSLLSMLRIKKLCSLFV